MYIRTNICLFNSPLLNYMPGHSIPSPPPHPLNVQVFAHVLEQLEPLCATEQEFCIAFFNFTEQDEMVVGAHMHGMHGYRTRAGGAFHPTCLMERCV